MPVILKDIDTLLSRCEWFKVFDIAEALFATLELSTELQSTEFQDGLNSCLYAEGIGWRMSNGRIVYRASDAFEKATKDAVDVLDAAGRQTSANEIREALRDISRT